MLRAPLAILALAIALPAAAQERGGVQLRNPMATLDKIDANRGCPLSATSVTVGLNKTFGVGSSAQQQLSTSNASDPSGCHPLVSTQVVAGVNMALGRGSSAGQSISAQGPRGALATTTYTRGYNVGYGAMSSANQRILNQTSR
jgi:hypothetical protein